MIPYGRQSIGPEDVEAVVATLHSDFLTQGPEVERFEAAIATRVGAAHAVSFSSGTAALHAATHAAGLGPGHRVATSALTFAASATCARHVGASVEAVDVDPTTLNMRLDAVDDVDAAVVVHYAGRPVDLAAWDDRPPIVIEDAAHALGATTPDGPVGNCAHSDLCCFSFHPVKAITTAEGGAVTTNDATVADRLRRFRHHGVQRRPERGGWAYEVVDVGLNYRLSDVHAALGTSQIGRLDAFVERRREIAVRYEHAFADCDAVTTLVPPPDGTTHAHHIYPVLVDDRDRVFADLRAAGIGVQVHYIPLPHHPALADLGPPERFPAAEHAYARLLSLPLHPGLTEDEQTTVVDAVFAATIDGPTPASTGPVPARRRPADEGGTGERTDRFAASERWWSRAQAVIPLGTQTRSKSPTQFARGATPIFLARGRGAHVWDVDGTRYLDFPMALGPVLLGYAEPVVDEAIRRQLADGITFSLNHPLEVEVAERIVALCPGVEAVRFGKSGSDALSAAVRATRAITGREVVLASGYHGWHDWYLGTTGQADGVPTATRSLVVPFPFDDIAALDAALDAHRGHVAAIVLEPSGATVPSPGYLEAAVTAARAHGALTVFDEVVTGFRVAPGGAREHYGVEPDFSCYGKALGNGMPVSAVGGRWDVMHAFDDVFFSGTHGGEALSLAAARAVLDTVSDGTVLTEIARRGRRLQDAVAERVEAHGLGGRVAVGGEPTRTVVRAVGPDAGVDQTFVQQRLAQARVLFNGSLFICARHTEAHVDQAVAAFDTAFATMAERGDVADLLTGPPIEPVLTPAPS